MTGMKNLNWLKMSGLTNTTMTALKVAMAVAMTFHRGTVQQCGGVPFDQLADPDSTITAQLASTADKTSVQNTPHTHPPSTGTHPHTLTCLVLSAACSLCKQAKAAKGALCPGPGVQQAGKWTLAGSRRGSRGGMRRTEEAAGPACSTNRPLQQDFQTLLHH